MSWPFKHVLGVVLLGLSLAACVTASPRPKTHRAPPSQAHSAQDDDFAEIR
jgi:hypothetical protein